MDTNTHFALVTNITENEDGSAIIDLELSDEFVDWFKKTEGLKRFSKKRFERFFKKTLSNYLDREETKVN